MTGNPLELFRKFFGAVRAIFWLCEPFLAPDLFPNPKQSFRFATVLLLIRIATNF